MQKTPVCLSTNQNQAVADRIICSASGEFLMFIEPEYQKWSYRHVTEKRARYLLLLQTSSLFYFFIPSGSAHSQFFLTKQHSI